MKRKDYLIIAVFALALILFAIFSSKISFHDSGEYITIAKNLAGIDNVQIFSAHSLLYPAFMALFLKIWPSLVMVKLVNCLWIFLIGLVLLWKKNKTAFILFALSPLTWFVSIQTTPVLPAAFFMLLAYLFLKEDKIKSNLAYSGLFLGLSAAVYDPMFLVAFFFILIYFWNRKFKDSVLYSIAILAGFLPRLILDAYLFGNPFYSLIKYIGANALITFGFRQGTGNLQFLNTGLVVLLVFVAISPLLFKIYSAKLKDSRKDLLFLGIVFLIFLIRGALLKYFIIISPIILLILAKIFTKKDVKWHCILSIPIIIGLTYGCFASDELIIQKDLNNIINDYKTDYIIAEPYQALYIAEFLWQNKPEIVWFEDFNASINNQSEFREYDFNMAKSKLRLKENLVFSARFERFENRTYDNYILVAKKDAEYGGFELDRCYSALCVYT